MIKYRLLFLLMILTQACFAENHIILLNLVEDKKQITLKPQLEFRTSDQVKEAIDNGIRVQIIAKAQLYQNNSWWFDKTLANKKIVLEVSFFTLGKLYIVKNLNTGEQLGFNDYKQLWSSFEKLMVFNFTTDNINQKTFVKSRIMLDKGALPVAMQINVLFDSNWDINTAWHQQKVLQN